MSTALSMANQRILALERRELETAISTTRNALSSPVKKERFSRITSHYDKLRKKGVDHELAMEIAGDQLEAIASTGVESKLSRGTAVPRKKEKKKELSFSQDMVDKTAERWGKKTAKATS